MPITPPTTPRGTRPFPEDEDDAHERVVPLARRERGPARGAHLQTLPVAQDGQEPGIGGARGRRVRRRRGTWLRRNAVSVVGLAILVALAGAGFGLAQVLSRGPVLATSAGMALPTAAPGSSVAGQPSGAPPADSLPPPASDAALSASTAVGSGATPASPGTGAIQFASHPLDPTYTVAAGDTLVAIGQTLKTTPARIQALNNISDARALSIGQKLIIPPEF